MDFNVSSLNLETLPRTSADATSGSSETDKVGCAVIAVYEDGQLSPGAQTLNSQYENIVQKLIDGKEINGKQGKATWLHHLPHYPANSVLLTGCGNSNGINDNDFRKLLKHVAETVSASASANVVLPLDDFVVSNRDNAWKAQQVAEIFSHVTYRFTQHKSPASDTDAQALTSVTVSVHDESEHENISKYLRLGQAIAVGVALTRDLGNHPSNICNPTFLSNEARHLATLDDQFTTEVLQEEQMKELGMNSLLSVAAGSDQPAQLIIMNYQGASPSEQPVVLVGKGITFDTGGISLKPPAGMDEMKFDMCGAASVMGVMRALIEAKPKLNVIGMIAAAENMPSGRATRPGDIVTSMSGQTIEILNTDAEGRLVLCDALTYAKQYNPKAVIDIATLTGACIIALGRHASGLYANQDALAQELLAAGVESGDRAWHMPLWDDYQKQLDSNFADVANVNLDREAGSVTAACFLARFTKDYPWAHLDVAGTASLSGKQKGATGRPVPLLLQYLFNQVSPS